MNELARCLRLSSIALAIGACLLAPAGALAATGISGTVTGPGAVDEVEVCIVEPLPSETCTFPSVDGKYQLLGLGGGTYQVEFLPSYRTHLVIQYYNHKAKLSEANKVVVNAGFVTNNVNADLEAGGQIEGTVRDFLGGDGLGSVEVCALVVTSGTAAGCTHTDAEGSYALPAVPPGSYRVGFWGERESAGYATQYYFEKGSFSTATPISVAAGETIAGIDAALRQGARVAGTVTDAASGAPLAEIAVCILAVAAPGPERCTFTGWRFRLNSANSRTGSSPCRKTTAG
jgi:Carboxypeptidase regulatory-like domain